MKPIIKEGLAFIKQEFSVQRERGVDHPSVS